MEFTYEYGQTLLTPEEADGLKVPVKTKSELNAIEARNIASAKEYYFSKSIKKEKLLTDDFICDVHKKMYGNVWKWAGDFRRSNKNIGCDYRYIGVELRKLIDDTIYWISKTNMSDEEIAIRFKHRIVAIHPFPNGNGRHSRLMCDLMYKKILGHSNNFTWGKSFSDGEGRKFYIQALKKADYNDYNDLIYFVTH